MEVRQTVDEHLVEAAFLKAREVGVDVPAPSLQALNAPIPDQTDTWINRIWDQVEGALRSARQTTVEVAEPIVQRTLALYEDAKKSLGKEIAAVTAVLLDRLNSWMNSILDGVLNATRATITIGGEVLGIKKATISRTVTLSGSFELSLKRVLDAATSSEFTINAEYEAK